MKTEHDIQNQIRMALSERGWCVFRANVGKVKMADGRWFDTGLPAGFSDLFAVKDGRVVFLEVKNAIGRARKDQERFLQTMRERYHCTAGIVRSVEEAVRLCEIAGVVHAHWGSVGRLYGKEDVGAATCPICGRVNIWFGADETPGNCCWCGSIMETEARDG